MMKANFKRIDHLFYLRDDLAVGDGTVQTMTLGQFADPVRLGDFNGLATENLGGFGFAADGVDDYLHITQGIIDWAAEGNDVLDFGSHHRPLFNDAVAWLRGTDAQTVTVVLAIEPVDGNLPTWSLLAKNADDDFAAKPMLVKLANELKQLRSDMQRIGKSLGIVIRFASEMNAPENPYGPKSDVAQPMLFKTAFSDMRDVFKGVDKGFAVCFSPALRADLPPQNIAHYYPGDDVVDFISGTWYVHGDDQFDVSKRNMRSYFASFAANNIPRGLDEVGGVDDDFMNCDDMLPRMIAELESFDVRDYALKTLGLAQIVSLIRVGNVSSRRVAEKIGMRLRHEVVRYERPYWMFGIHAEG